MPSRPSADRDRTTLAERDTAAPRVRGWLTIAYSRRWAPRILGISAAVLVPWAWWLAATLPDRTEVRNWASTWVGLDLLLAAGCATTAVLHRKADDRARAAAGATATVAVLDVWFDVLTAQPGAALLQALLSAVLELTFACYCARIAVCRPESLAGPSAER